MGKVDPYGEIRGPQLSQGDAELIALRDAEKSWAGCTYNGSVRSCYWLESCTDRGTYYEVILEGHASCAENVLRTTILRYRVEHSGNYTSSQQQKGQWECPHCNRRCLIVTACFGDPSLQVDLSRRYRDQVLRSSVSGRTALDGYYAVSPYIARLMRTNSAFRAIIRVGLVRPLLAYAQPALDRAWNTQRALALVVAYPFLFSIWTVGTALALIRRIRVRCG